MTGRRLLVVAAALLLVNSGYLVAAEGASLFHAAQILLHPLLGIVALKLLVWRRRQIAEALRADPLRRFVLVLGGATAATGLVLLGTGVTPATRPLLAAHVAVAVGLAALLARFAPLQAPILLGAAIALGGGLRQLNPDPAPVLNAGLPPLSMEGEAMGGADGPFFPSAAETAHGGLIPEDFFRGSAECGRCHADIAAEWEDSAHRFASFNNPWYRRSIEYMQSLAGVTPSKWCAGCHDHAVLFSGQMDRPLEEIVDTPAASAGLACVSCHSVTRVKDTMGNGGFVIEYPELNRLAASDDPLLRTLHDLVLHLDPEPHRKTFLKPLHVGDSSAFCSSCHKVHLDKPVNDYRWLRGFNSYDNWQASGVSGDGARSFYYPEASETCADCHMPLVPGSDPAAPDGMIRSHRFAAANTALPVHFGRDEQLRAVREFLEDDQASVDLFAMVRGDAPTEEDAAARTAGADPLAAASTFAVGEESGAAAAPGRVSYSGPPGERIAPLDAAAPSVRPGESIRVDVVVRTRRVGHFFPSGTVDAQEAWLELRAEDRTGRTFFWSGFTGDGRPDAASDADGPVDPSAHFYRSLLLDGHGNRINKRNAWAARSALYVMQIPPGAADTVRYRIRIPEDAEGEVRLFARLNYRKFDWWHTQWVFRGRRAGPANAGRGYDDGVWELDPEIEAPVLPIITMASDSIRLPVARADDAGSDPASPEQAEPPGAVPDRRARALRFNDYGIGLLLRGDLRAAESAFAEVARLDPGYADAFVNQARVRVREGDPEGAIEVLRSAFALEPDLPRARFFQAMALKALGRYDEALDHLHQVLAAHPRDRVANNQVGRLLFLKREFEDAIATFSRTLRIDPEDLEAHYNLMLSWQGLGDAENAARHRALYLRFKADETAQFLTGEYRRTHPEDNNERLMIHEHRNGLGSGE